MDRTTGTVKLALSPLWFLVVYLLLVTLLPPARWLDRRLGWTVLPVLAGVAIAVDVARLGFGVPWIGWLISPSCGGSRTRPVFTTKR